MNTIKHLVFLILVVCVIRSAPARPETRTWQSQAVAIITFGYIATLAVGVRRPGRRQDPDPLGALAKRPWNGGDL